MPSNSSNSSNSSFSMKKNTRRMLLILLLSIHGCIYVCMPALASQYKKALPGYKYEFPADHASHDDFKTEWWYFTGHLKNAEGRKFGYELTFFRQGLLEENSQSQSSINKTGKSANQSSSNRLKPWQLDNAYLAHFAVSDIDNGKFYHFEKLNRKGLGLADARKDHCLVHNENWTCALLGEKLYIEADSKDFSIKLLLTPIKKPVIHGKNGVSQKAACKGCASHYYSLTRLVSEGLIIEHIDKNTPDRLHLVKGQSWMDHEFGSNQLAENQIGWDWFSIQLDDRTELMLYFMRLADGSMDIHSSGTYIENDGSSRYLQLSEFDAKVLRRWHSPKSNGDYPVSWRVQVPSVGLDLELIPLMDDQELVAKSSTGVTYWEGAVEVRGSKGGSKISGNGYVELTGYAGRFRKRI